MTTPSQQLAAALADRYRIERELGAGGMATVYLAQDLRHDRKVALKVLRPELAAIIGADRFLQEIKTTANLQHPHILALFDSGHIGEGRGGDFVFYVMPYVEGESLRDRLTREKQLPVDDAVRIAREVADALGYAHSQGVVHRDIKPENILLHGGHAMVADFGIALAAARSDGGSRMTETGMSLGTPHYMAPEQAMGEREITAKADIYALGCVLYEMLTAEPPFTGATAQAIVARVMTEQPRSLTAQRRTIPPHIEAAVQQALEKLPADRFASAAEFAAALEGKTTGRYESRTTQVTAPIAQSPNRLIAFGALAVIAIAVSVLAIRGGSPEAPVSRQRVTLWRHPFASFLSPGLERYGSQAAIAPDGSSIVFSDSVGATLQLLRKLRQETEPTPLAGTEGGLSPFFSPDGEWIGYVTVDGKLRKMPSAGGGSITLAEDAQPVYNVAAWLDDQTIVYLDDEFGLRRVSAGGGASTVVTRASSAGRLNGPSLWPLPGSRGILYTACPGNCGVGSAVSVYDFAADSARLLVERAAGAWYAPTGHLLYTDRDGGLYAAEFDPKSLTLRSGAVPVIEGVHPMSFTLSPSGAALYTVGGGGASLSELVWVTRDGAATPIDSAWRGRFEYPALSPDGNSLAVSLQDDETHIWIRRPNGSRQRLTNEGTVNWRPWWTRDGQSIVFLSNRAGVTDQDNYDAYLGPADGSAPASRIVDYTSGLWEAEYSRDGKWLVIRADEPGSGGNVYARRTSGDTTLMPLLADKSLTVQVALSPDSRWLAYASNESGRPEIYVTSFPDMKVKRLISRDGGTEPRWANSGRELFFKSGGRLMAVDVAPGPSFTSGVPRALFSVAGYHSARNRQQYDVSPDDRRFLMIRELGGDAPGEVVYVENWFQELRTKMKVKR